MATAILLAACVIAGNHYSWTGWDSRWNDADNWGAMDYPHLESDDVTIGQTWGVGWEPSNTIDVSADYTINSIDVWSNYTPTLTGHTLTVNTVTGADLVVKNKLIATSIELDTLTIGSPITTIPEPNTFVLLILGSIGVYYVYKSS